MEEINKPESLEDRKIDLLYHAMKALDEMRGRTLIYNKYRDTQRVADAISGVLKEIKKQYEQREESLQLESNTNNNSRPS